MVTWQGLGIQRTGHVNIHTYMIYIRSKKGQRPSKQDDDAVLDGDKKAISTQLHNSVIYKALQLYYSLV